MEAGQNLLGGDHMKNNIKLSTQMDLSGKTALIIGGSGSIGSKICEHFLNAGADLIIASRNTKNNIKNKNRIFIQLDASNEEDVKSCYKWLMKRYKTIDILIFANGIQHRKPFEKIKLDDWNSVIKHNLTSVFLICKYFTKPMIKYKYGKIIGITSLTSYIGIKNISSYSASKGGMSQFLMSLATELVDYNISVNMIAPGRIKTAMTSDLIMDEKLNKLIKNRIPMGRYGSPSDISGVALFLASSFSDYMTGQSIIIDGGWLASGGNIPA